MGRIYKSAKGIPVDMEALRTANEHSVAAGNMKVNAKGDVIKGGKVIQTAKERTAPHYESGKQVARTSLRKPQKEEIVKPAEPVVIPKKTDLSASVTKVRRRKDGSEYKETIHPDGTIDVEEMPTRGGKSSI